MTTVDGRTRHYGEFYGVGGTDSATDPVMLVWGNCQAEALRVLIGSVQTTPYRTVRVPPVHELVQGDLDHLRRLLARTRVLLTQPVRTGYRDLPLGVADVVSALPASATVIRWPVIRCAALHPFQVIARHPACPSRGPDRVPYHDLRTVRAAARGLAPNAERDVAVSADAIREAATADREELARREHRDTDVRVSDLLADAGPDAAHTINHPGNQVLMGVADRLLRALGVHGGVADPGRILLGSIRAPIEARVLAALGMAGVGRSDWVVDGDLVSDDDIHRDQMRWYARHPDFIGVVVKRHAERVGLLGLNL